VHASGSHHPACWVSRASLFLEGTGEVLGSYILVKCFYAPIPGSISIIDFSYCIYSNIPYEEPVVNLLCTIQNGYFAKWAPVNF
jgi:hypothetical protein